MYCFLRCDSILCPFLLLYYALHSFYLVTEVIEELQLDKGHAYYFRACLANERLVSHEASVEFTCYYANTDLIYSPGLKSSAIDCAIEPCRTASETTGACCVALHDSTTASI